MIIAGKAASIYIPELPHLAESGRRLRGWRLLHTHLTDEGLSQEDLMDMLFLRLDAAIALTVDEQGFPGRWQAAWLKAPDQYDSGDPYQVAPFRPWHESSLDFRELAAEVEKDLSSADTPGQTCGEIAVLVSVSTQPVSIQERNLDELEELAATAGLKVGGRLCQRIGRRDPRYILGKGKLAELEVMALRANAGMLVFDGELAPAQLHKLADVTERKVLDRTQLILDIFAQHALSKAGRLQVELAQLAYALPRLAGQRNKAFDRLMGGIGGRGPGESRLETDRRRIRERMGALRRALEKLRGQRGFTRQRRERNGIPVAALVGYTNAGKSSLLNALTASSVTVANQLFATLDTATRRLRFPQEREITISDTVGFIRNLPRELREAFRATLEELDSADLLIHVADASHPELDRQLEAVYDILADLDLTQKPLMLVLNKCDLLTAEARLELSRACPGAILVSAATKSGLDEFLLKLEQELFMGSIQTTANAILNISGEA